MEKEQIIDILQMIKSCLNNDLLFEAKELVRIEIENLNGITEQKCRNTKYYFYDWYCKYCSNLNCSSNKNR